MFSSDAECCVSRSRLSKLCLNDVMGAGGRGGVLNGEKEKIIWQLKAVLVSKTWQNGLKPKRKLILPASTSYSSTLKRKWKTAPLLKMLQEIYCFKNESCIDLCVTDWKISFTRFTTAGNWWHWCVSSSAGSLSFSLGTRINGSIPSEWPQFRPHCQEVLKNRTVETYEGRS